jgi:cobalt-zinc-cadmium efflux system outer membrane protein
MGRSLVGRFVVGDAGGGGLGWVGRVGLIRRSRGIDGIVALGALASLALASSGCVSAGPRALRAARGEVAALVEGRVDWSGAEEPRDAVSFLSSLPNPWDAAAAARHALVLDPALAADLEDLGVAQGDYAQATRLANPTLFGARLGVSPGSGRQTTVGAALDILDFLILPLRKRHAALEYEAAKLRVGQRLVDEVAVAGSAFYEAVAARQVAARLESVLELERAAVTLAERQLEAGNLSRLDLAEQRAEALATEGEVRRARLAAGAAAERLAVEIGFTGDPARLPLPDALPEPSTMEPDVARLEESALAERLDLQALRIGVTTVDRALSLARATRFSPVGVEVGWERETEPDGSRLSGPSLEIRLPLFDLGGASLARLEAEKRRLERQVDATTLAARSEVRRAHAGAMGLHELLVLERGTLLPERLRILDETLRRYNMMLTGVYEVLAAKRAEIETERATVETWKDYWLARVALDRAVGGTAR